MCVCVCMCMGVLEYDYKEAINERCYQRPVRLFPIFLVLISATRDIDQSTIHDALTFSNNSYLRTINRATRQLLTENKSENASAQIYCWRFIAPKNHSSHDEYNVMKNGHRRGTRGGGRDGVGGGGGGGESRVQHMRAIPSKMQRITCRNSL